MRMIVLSVALGALGALWCGMALLSLWRKSEQLQADERNKKLYVFRRTYSGEDR